MILTCHGLGMACHGMSQDVTGMSQDVTGCHVTSKGKLGVAKSQTQL